MAANPPRIQFRDYLPEVFRADEVDGVSFLSRFLEAFETLFEELQGEIEGAPGGASGGIPDLFGPDTTPPPQFQHRASFIITEQSLTNLKSEGVPDDVLAKLESIKNREVIGEENFQRLLNDTIGEEQTVKFELVILKHARQQPDFDHLNYLASWIGLPLRAEKSVAWNRRFFKTAISLHQQRGALPGLDAMLRAWLKDDLMETAPPLLILTDLTRAHTDVNAVFQLGVTATLGVDTVLGEGAPYFFIADLITDPAVRELRQPEGLDVFEQAARSLLDAEKPAHTYYQLRVRAHTMQLAPAEVAPVRGFPFPYAQVGVTTMLWEEPWVFTSDC